MALSVAGTRCAGPMPRGGVPALPPPRAPPRPLLVAGDLHGARGRSLYVRLRPRGRPASGPMPPPASTATSSTSSATASAPRRSAPPSTRPAPSSPCPWGCATSREAARADPPASWDGAAAARRLWRRCRPLEGTCAEAYLRARGLGDCRFPALRFHPALAYRDAAGWCRFPALVAAVSGPDGTLEGVQRTWLHPARPAKAPVAQPRKALGRVHGHAVRFGAPGGDNTTLLVGEGVETVLSLVAAVPHCPPPLRSPPAASPPSSRPRRRPPPHRRRPRRRGPARRGPGSKPGRWRRASPPSSSPPRTATSTTTSPPSGRGRWPARLAPLLGHGTGP